MLKTKAAFIVYGVHKDGILDTQGNTFIDEKIIEEAKQALIEGGLEIAVHETIIATKQEAIDAFSKAKKDDSIDALVLFSGTWVWSAHLLAALQDFSNSGKAIVIWTHPGSQGWRPVGGLVLTAALKEIGLKHRFVYGASSNPLEVQKIISYCKASAMRKKLNLATVCSFGGRGMGQNCGAADPSQWVKMFGIDIDSRDTTKLIETAKKMDETEVETYRLSLTKYFNSIPPDNDMTNRSIRIFLAMKQLKREWNFDYYTIQSFPGIADDYVATCFMQSMMMEEGIATSTISDFNTLLTNILLTEMSSERVYYGDLQHINKEEKEIKIIGDGAIPPSLAGSLSGYKASFADHGIPTEGAAGGLSVQLVAKSGEGILARLGRVNGKFQMVLTKCKIFEPSREEIDKRRKECGIPAWPHAFIRFECDADKLIQSWNNEYACLGYGYELYQQIIDFCELTEIEVIAL